MYSLPGSLHIIGGVFNAFSIVYVAVGKSLWPRSVLSFISVFHTFFSLAIVSATRGKSCC